MSAEQARVVVIGGGITGCSVAYHLALAGWTDVLLVEKAQLTAGSTCQAAGLVTAFNPSSTMMAFRRYSIELYREPRRLRDRRQPAPRLEPRSSCSSWNGRPAGRAASGSTSRSSAPTRRAG